MESSSWPETLPSSRIKAIQELTKGQVLTNKLRELLDQPIESDLESVNGVVEQILGMFNNTLSILSSSSLNEIPRILCNDMRSPSSSEDQKSVISNESIKTMKPVKTKRGCYKRRKNASTITKVTSTLVDDGYAWRKYGQKTILNSRHQRNYYRCSHKVEQGCQATKQVQKIDDKPSKYMITYNGFHTCKTLQRAPQIIMEASKSMDNSTLISFETNAPMKNNMSGTCFSNMKHIPNEGFLSLGHMKHEQVSSSDPHTPCDPIVGLSQVPSRPMSMVSCGLDREDMVSPGVFSSTCSTHGYKIDDIIESQDIDDFISELCSS